MSVIENPWRNFDEFDPASFEGQSSEPPQWPIKLWKAPVASPYFHKAHLLVAADCSAFSYANFHAAYAAGKVPLICCPATDFDITSRLADILRHNDVKSVTVVQMEAPCCRDLKEYVRQAVVHSHLPVPVQVATVFTPGEDLEEDEEFTAHATVRLRREKDSVRE
jgi:hypothetical protein